MLYETPKPREAALKSCPGKSPLEPVNTLVYCNATFQCLLCHPNSGLI